MRRKLIFESLHKRLCFALGDVVTSFAQTGEYSVSYPVDGAISSYVVHTATLPDGQLIVGHTLGSNGRVFTLTKLDGAGRLDNGFGTNGQTHFIDSQTPDSQLVQALSLADGRVLLRSILSGLSNSIAFEQTNLIMLDVDGNIDTTFATGGYLRLDKQQVNVWKVLPDRSGGFFVTGNPTSVNQTVLTHYTPAGAVDVAFGQAGTVAVPRLSDPRAFVDNQNRLTVWGNKPFSASTVAYRFLSSGATDVGYGTAGVVEVPAIDLTSPIAFAEDGESMLRLTRSADFSTYFVTRHLANFQLDPTYASGGTQSIPTNLSSKNVVKLAHLADGGALLVNSSVVGGPNPQIELQSVKLTSNGSLNTNYGMQGISERMIDSNGFEVAAVSIDSLGGFFWTQRSGPFVANFLAYHARPDGSADPQFGTAGITNFDVSLQATSASYLQLDPLANGRVRIQSGWPGAGLDAGTIGQSNTLNSNGNSVQSSGFGSGMRGAIVSSTPSADGGWFIAQRTHPVLSELVISRYRSDGTLNTSFGTSGRIILATNDITNIVARTASDGSVIIVADCWENKNTNLGLTTIVRFQSSGQLDTNFGTGGVLRLSSNPESTTTGRTTPGTIVDVQIDNESGLILIHNADGLAPLFLQRISATGNVHLQFGTNGLVQVTKLGQWVATETDEDGRIYVLTIEPRLLDYVYGLTQWTARGEAIQSFGANGSVILPIDPVIALPHVEMETRQGLVVVAASHDPVNSRLRLVALDYGGQPWSELGPGGVRDYELAADGEMVADLEFASDGSLWLATIEREGLSRIGKVIKLQGTNVAPLRNWFTALDVTSDFAITPLDALVVISVLNGLQRPVGMYPDVNGDGRITALDALLVINYLNNNPSGEGESGWQIDAPTESEVDALAMLSDITELSGTRRRKQT